MRQAGGGWADSLGEEPVVKAKLLARLFSGASTHVVGTPPLFPPVLETETLRALIVSHPCDKKSRMDGALAYGALLLTFHVHALSTNHHNFGSLA